MKKDAKNGRYLQFYTGGWVKRIQTKEGFENLVTRPSRSRYSSASLAQISPGVTMTLSVLMRPSCQYLYIIAGLSVMSLNKGQERDL